MLRIGLAGCGGIGGTHARALHAVATELDIAVTALADVRPEYAEGLREFWPEAALYDSAQAMLDKAELDAVWVTLPSYLHAEYAIKALEKGLDVFVEKPMALSKEDLAAMCAAQQRSGRKAAVGQVLRYFPAYAKLREVIEELPYGPLKSLQMTRISGMPRWSFENWFADMKKSGSVIMDLHIHDLDMLRAIFGEIRPEEIRVLSTSFPDGMPNEVITILPDRDGAFVTAEGRWDVSGILPFGAEYTASFERATLKCGRDGLWLYRDDDTKKEIPLAQDTMKDDHPAINVGDVLPYALEDRVFLRSILFGEPLQEADFADAAASAELGLAVLEKAR